MTVSRPATMPVENSDPYDVFFKTLNDKGIEWCSWKSNEHLDAGLAGYSDVDLLFDPESQRQVFHALQESGFLIFRAPQRLAMPGVIDGVALDIETGKLLHAHCHFLLCTGKKYIKNAILPWEKEILRSRVAVSNVYIVSAEEEAVLLLTRIALKIRLRDLQKIDRKALWGNADFKAEFNWLKARINSEDLVRIARKRLNDEAAEIIKKSFADGCTGEMLLSLRAELLKLAAVREWHRMGKTESFVQGLAREAFYILMRLSEKAGIENNLVRRRVLPDGGIVIACLGADGSGKSTVTRTLAQEWSHKIDVAYVYFGTGDGPQSILQRFIKSLGQVKKRLSGPSGIKQASQKPGSENSISLSTIAMAVAGALRKRACMRRVRKLKKKGFIVFCDRWPQNQVPGKNDGKMLGSLKNSKNPFLRALSAWESRAFDQLCENSSLDIVIKLFASPETALSRKKENADIASLIVPKIDALKVLDFPGADQFTIDADRPLKTVLQEVRSIVWEKLRGRPVREVSVYTCTGLPGAGKTTLSQKISAMEDIGTVDEIFSEPVNKVALLFRSVFEMPVLYFLIIKFILRLNLWKSPYSMGLLLRMPVQKIRLRNKASGNRYFIEQLFLQNIWSALVDAGISHVRPQDLASLIRKIFSDIDPVVFHFDINPETAAARVARRKKGTSRFDGLPEQEIREKISQSSALMKDIVRAARFAGIDVVVLKAEQDPEIVQKKILENL